MIPGVDFHDSEVINEEDIFDNFKFFWMCATYCLLIQVLDLSVKERLKIFPQFAIAFYGMSNFPFLTLFLTAVAYFVTHYHVIIVVSIKRSHNLYVIFDT